LVALATDVAVLVAGGGFGGLLMGGRLRQAGVGEFAIVENASGFGETWRWRHHSCVACDIE